MKGKVKGDLNRDQEGLPEGMGGEEWGEEEQVYKKHTLCLAKRCNKDIGTDKETVTLTAKFHALHGGP